MTIDSGLIDGQFGAGTKYKLIKQVWRKCSDCYGKWVDGKIVAQRMTYAEVCALKINMCKKAKGKHFIIREEI